MSIEQFLPIEALFSLLITTALLLGSPGPATIAMATVGASVGIKNGLPFLSGLSIALVAALTGLSLFFKTYPILEMIFGILGSVYMVYIAYKIATSPLVSKNVSQTAPKFRDGFILNLLNPKAYAVFLALFTQYSGLIVKVAGVKY
ncbi:MAG: LysE family transporter [Pseudomonadota bacterium]